MSYDLYDFTESLRIAGVEPQRVAHVTLAFGESPEGYGSWEGGFVCHTRSGKPWVFVFGWCDTTGWGCQDGAWVYEFDAEPTEEQVRQAWSEAMGGGIDPEMWAQADRDPIDLKRYLLGEIDVWGKVLKGAT
jgi:hypothetical protein